MFKVVAGEGHFTMQHSCQAIWVQGKRWLFTTGSFKQGTTVGALGR